MIEITKGSNGSVKIKIEGEELENVKQILSAIMGQNLLAQSRIQMLSTRFSELEKSIAKLVEINRQLAEALGQRKERRTRLPAKGTKYFDRLWHLCSNHLDGIFTSDELPPNERHILSILKNEYGVIKIAERKGRRNFYRIEPSVARELLRRLGYFLGLPVRNEIRARIDKIVSQIRKDGGRFILDISKDNSNLVYEFYFPDRSVAEFLEKHVAELSNR